MGFKDMRNLGHLRYCMVIMMDFLFIKIFNSLKRSNLKPKLFLLKISLLTLIVCGIYYINGFKATCCFDILNIACQP